MTRTIDQLVSSEVHYCVSFLVSTVAKSCGELHATADLSEAAEQAMELCSPLADYEEAAIQAGWIPSPYAPGSWVTEEYGETISVANAATACDQSDIEPHEREVFEHWIVSEWLAGKLAERGEKVDTDFMGLTVWARTTTGQGIASDSVIIAIHADASA